MLAFGVALVVVSRVMRVLPVSVAYPVWAGGGTAGAATAALWLYSERAGPRRLLGVGMVIAGIVVLNVSAPA